MGKSILIMGHAYIVGANREVWARLGQREDINVDLIIPRKWESNLIGSIEFQKNNQDEKGFNKIFPVDVFFKGNGSIYFPNLFQLWKVLKNKKYDLVVINQEGWSFSLLAFNLMSFFTSNLKTKKFLMIAQNIKKDHLKWAIPLEKFNLKFVDLILGCCSETEDVLRWKKIVTPWKYFPLFYNSALELSEIKPFSNDKLKIGYIGRLSEEKGIKTLLNSYQELKKNENVELVIAGDGPLRESVENAEVNYLGLLSHDKVKDFYKEIDVLIVPSISKRFWKEQFGRVIVEAVAYGVPVVGSSSGAIPEVLGELELDYIFEELNSNELCKQILRVKEDIAQEKLIDKISRAQKLCREKFSEEAFLNRLLRYENE